MPARSQSGRALREAAEKAELAWAICGATSIPSACPNPDAPLLLRHLRANNNPSGGLAVPRSYMLRFQV